MLKIKSKVLLSLFATTILSSLSIEAVEAKHANVRHEKHFEKYLIKRVVINITGEQNQSEFRDIKEEYLNKEIESSDIANIEKKLSNYFLKKDYLMPRVSISSSALKVGVLEINVIPKLISNVIIFNDGPDNKLIKEYVAKILENKYAKTDYLERYFALMNRIPGYQVDYQFRPTKNIDEDELVLSISKDKLDILASIDSYGSSTLGQMENYISAQAFDTKGGSDAISFSGSTTNHPDRLFTLSAGYIVPINSLGTNANINVSHSENNSTLQNNIHTTNGTTNNLTAGLNHLIYKDKKQSLEGELDAIYNSVVGYTLNNDNGNVEDTSSKYFSFALSLNYSLSDDFKGMNTANLRFLQGVSGKFTNYSDPTNIADKHYNVYQADLARNQELPYNFSVYSRVMAGDSDHALPSSEQFSLGGRDFGRGYASSILAGNKIIAASAEVRYDHEIDNNQWLQSAQPYIFRDFGYVGKQSSDTTLSHISSYGAGVRFSVAFDIDIEGEVAQPMKKNYMIYGDTERSNTVYSAMISKSINF